MAYFRRAASYYFRRTFWRHRVRAGSAGLVASLGIARRDILGLVYTAAYMRACVLRSAMLCRTLAMGICTWSGGMQQEYGRAWRLMLCGAACGDVLVICCQAGGEMMGLDIREY